MLKFAFSYELRLPCREPKRFLRIIRPNIETYRCERNIFSPIAMPKRKFGRIDATDRRLPIFRR